MNMACYQRQFFSTYIDKYTHTYAGLILHQLEGVAVIKCCQGRLTLALKCNKTNYVCLSVCLSACLPACLPTYLPVHIHTFSLLQGPVPWEHQQFMQSCMHTPEHAHVFSILKNSSSTRGARMHTRKACLYSLCIFMRCSKTPKQHYLSKHSPTYTHACSCVIKVFIVKFVFMQV